MGWFLFGSLLLLTSQAADALESIRLMAAGGKEFNYIAALLYRRFGAKAVWVFKVFIGLAVVAVAVHYRAAGWAWPGKAMVAMSPTGFAAAAWDWRQLRKAKAR